MGKSILSIALGFLIGFIVIALIEASNILIYPPPAGLDLNDPVALEAYVAQVPTGAKVIVLFAWAVGTFAAGLTAAKVATKSKITHALIVGGVFMMAGIYNMLTIPTPLWFWIVGLIIYLPAAYLGGIVATNKKYI